jgi:hypothetical protein
MRLARPIILLVFALAGCPKRAAVSSPPEPERTTSIEHSAGTYPKPGETPGTTNRDPRIVTPAPVDAPPPPPPESFENEPR